MLRRIAVLMSAATLTYVVMDLLPGDAASALVVTSDAEQLRHVQHHMGLDEPLPTRLWTWMSGLLFHLDGGTLYRTGASVWLTAAPAVRNSAILLAIAFPLLLLLGVTTGSLAGLRPNSTRDRSLTGGAQVTLATPDFALTIMLLVVLAGWLRVAPTVSLVPAGGTPFDRPEILLVPALALAITGGAWLHRMVRAAIADATLLPHVQAAHLSGQHPAAVYWHHIMPAAKAPIAQACAATVPYAVAGTLVVENVVGFPGFGTLLAALIAGRETVAVATLTAGVAAITVASFAAADAIGRWLR
ncbi:ABC transporter permease subunit [Corynebacterium ulceribovis]|uniref:ABC transporter permease n=1 Tax=Corynebacterium ulceribovis TaxID=487732 RepID=UPI00047574B1